ncbi:MAG: hypothetical protein GY850_01325 [bacterium]|nr:hypothetical protein [bacterium]
MTVDCEDVGVHWSPTYLRTLSAVLLCAHARYARVGISGSLRPGNDSEDCLRDGVTILDVSDYHPLLVASKTWRQLIHKVWKVDSFVCELWE